MPTIPQILNGAKTTVKVASAVASIAPMAAPFVKRGAGKVSDMRRGREEKRAQKRAAKREAKTLAALESADRELDAEQVEELWAEYGQHGRLGALGYLGGPGCFAILTLGAGSEDGEAIANGDDIRGYLVGAGTVMGRAVHGQLSGEGDKDVYADYKYGQPMRVLFFPCLPEDFDKVGRALRAAFDPARAYGHGRR